MNKLLLSLAAVASVGAALPAAAQTWDQDRYDGYQQPYNRGDRDRDDYDRGGYGRNGGAQLNREFAVLSARINAAYRRGEITRYEASRLNSDLGIFQGVRIKYSRNGMNPWEVRSIEERLRNLSVNLERARRGERPYNGGNRYSYNYNDNYNDNYNQYGW